MTLSDLKNAWRRLRQLTQTLSDQGVTNVRQLYAWLLSVDVSTKIVSYLRSHPGLQGIIYWIAAIAVGLFAVSYEAIFHALSSVAQALTVSDAWWAMAVLAPVGFVASAWLVWRFAPGAGGGGIPEVMTAMEVDPQRASFWTGARTGAVKFVSSLVCAASGGAIGREGPTIQIAASVFYSLGMPFRKIWPSLSHQSLLVAGGSAGIAAAFNTPLGGIVFAVEELSQQHFNRFKTFLISAVIISGLVAQWILGPYLYLGYPKLNPVSFAALPWALATGLICGLAGGVFGRIMVLTYERLRHLGFSRQWKLSAAAGLVVAVTSWVVGSEALGSGSDLITRVLFEETNREVTWGVVFARFFTPLVTNAASVAGGIFAPSLSAGAAIGAKFAEVSGAPYANLLVLLGMASFLSGVTRAPFTAFVLVLEMTDRHSAIFPLMMSSLVASLAAKAVDSRSYYERRCEAYLAGISAGAGAKAEKSSTPPQSHNPSSQSTAPPGEGPSGL